MLKLAQRCESWRQIARLRRHHKDVLNCPQRQRITRITGVCEPYHAVLIGDRAQIEDVRAIETLCNLGRSNCLEAGLRLDDVDVTGGGHSCAFRHRVGVD